MLIALALLALRPSPADAPPTRALTLRLIRPDEQGRRLLALFEGSKARHPAAAMAAYRRATGGKVGISRAAEALIAALNPDMVAELATVDGATIRIGRHPDGKAAWDALIPRDDGTFSAVATALALTDGAADAPMDELRVDRLGRPGSAVSARVGEAFALADGRDGLEAALGRARQPGGPRPVDSGLVFGLDARALASAGYTIGARRMGEGLLSAGLDRLDGTVAIEGDVFQATVVGHPAGTTTPAARARPAIDPAWLDGVPAEGTLAAFALGLDPRPAAWDAFFDGLDRGEKLDPAAAKAAPVRLRLNILAGGAGIRPDVDLLPVLVGLAGFATLDPSGKLDGVLVRLICKDEAAATRLRDRTIPLLGRPFKLKVDRSGGQIRLVGPGRPILIGRDKAVVSLSWGDRIAEATVRAAGDPSRSASTRLRVELGRGAGRFVAFWPGRLPGLAAPQCPPAVWVGREDGKGSVDTIRWPGLKGVVRGLLDRLPMDPPPDASTPLGGKG